MENTGSVGVRQESASALSIQKIRPQSQLPAHMRFQVTRAQLLLDADIASVIELFGVQITPLDECFCQDRP